MCGSSWTHEKEGVVMVDARPANALVDLQGRIYMIDVMLIEVDAFLRKSLYD